MADEGSSFLYTYDLGDYWRHELIVEKAFSAASGATLPNCADGRRACPPEDCGGTGSYAELVDILVDPSNPEHEERLEWYGSFDPEHSGRPLLDDWRRLLGERLRPSPPACTRRCVMGTRGVCEVARDAARAGLSPD
jgi:hypothetical protein